jgi:hypothetical protein
LSRILDPISDLLCLARLARFVLTASAVNAAEPLQIPIHLKQGGVELRPGHAEPIKERVADIMIR